MLIVPCYIFLRVSFNLCVPFSKISTSINMVLYMIFNDDDDVDGQNIEMSMFVCLTLGNTQVEKYVHCFSFTSGWTNIKKMIKLKTWRELHENSCNLNKKFMINQWLWESDFVLGFLWMIKIMFNWHKIEIPNYKGGSWNWVFRSENQSNATYKQKKEELPSILW
jgi:hypothetical protein